MQVFTVVERKLVVIVPCFEAMLRYPNINLCINESSGNSCLIDDTTGKTCTIERAKFFISAVTFVSFHATVCVVVVS